MKKRFEQRLILTAIVATIALNLPILYLFNDTKEIAGFPLLWIWIFGIWIFVILISYFTILRKSE